MPYQTLANFHLIGLFGGFVRTIEGKRRMLLHTEGGEMQLKVPKPLRKGICEELREGTRIEVRGLEEHHRFSGTNRLLVVDLFVMGDGSLRAAEPPRELCAIRVCAKKNCWRSGGSELYALLRHAAQETGLEGVLEIKQVGCLGNCKRAPNLMQGKHLYEHCTPRHARALVTAAAEAMAHPAH